MKRKLLAMAMMACMFVSLVACGGSSGGAAADNRGQHPYRIFQEPAGAPLQAGDGGAGCRPGECQYQVLCAFRKAQNSAQVNHLGYNGIAVRKLLAQQPQITFVCFLHGCQIMPIYQKRWQRILEWRLNLLRSTGTTRFWSLTIKA